MVRPMGPLEAGEQAIVDAITLVPEGRHSAERDGIRVVVVKQGDASFIGATAEAFKPDGSSEEVRAFIDVTLGSNQGVVMVDRTEWAPDDDGEPKIENDITVDGKSVARSNEDDAQLGGSLARQTEAPIQAQNTKLEVALKLVAATELLTEAGAALSSQ